MDITFQSKLIVTFQKYVFNKSMFFSNFKSQDFRTVACSSLPVPWPSEWETSKTLILVTKSFEQFDGKVITKHIITAIIGKKRGLENNFNEIVLVALVPFQDY